MADRELSMKCVCPCIVSEEGDTQVGDCAGLNENGPHRPRGSDTIRRCGLVEEPVLLEVGFVVSEARARPSGSHCILFAADLCVDLFPQHQVCLRAAMLPAMMIVD